MHARRRACVEADAVDEVGVCVMLEILAAVSELTARCLRKEKLSIVAERFFGIICLQKENLRQFHEMIINTC